MKNLYTLPNLLHRRKALAAKPLDRKTEGPCHSDRKKALSKASLLTMKATGLIARIKARKKGHIQRPHIKTTGRVDLPYCPKSDTFVDLGTGMLPIGPEVHLDTEGLHEPRHGIAPLLRNVPPSAGMSPRTNAPQPQSVLSTSHTYRQQVDRQQQFLANMKTYQKTGSAKAAEDIDAFLDSLDASTIRRALAKLSPSLLERFNRYVNPIELAQLSTMNLEVRYVHSVTGTRKGNRNAKNDGKYRLYMVRGDNELEVHFQRSHGFVIYLIYLLDRRLHGDDVDTMNLKHCKALFCRLYEMVYGLSGESYFDQMMRELNAQQKVKQKGIYQILAKTRDDIIAACETMHEAAEPFILRNISSHLAVLPRHIILPKEMLELVGSV